MMRKKRRVRDGLRVSWRMYAAGERRLADTISNCRMQQYRLRQKWILYDMKMNALREQLRQSLAARGIDYDASMEQQYERVAVRRRNARRDKK